MPDHNSNPLYLHPALHAALPGILQEITSALPANWTAITGEASIHRTQNEQFGIFKKGRTFRNGNWVKTGTTFTTLDGFKKKSRHNFLPALAVDILLLKPDGQILLSGPEEAKIQKGARKFGFEWGGDWVAFQDQPHIQLPKPMLFKNSLERDEVLQWQKYLFHGGKLTAQEELDGFWGDHSRKALNALAGTRERTLAAWARLFNLFGPVEDLPDFAAMTWIPAVR